jgi:hypothetical protein
VDGPQETNFILTLRSGARERAPHFASKNQRGLTQNDEHLDQVEHLEQDEKVDHLDLLKHRQLAQGDQGDQ